MRRILDVTITDTGRDKGKLFKITEMSADAAEWWAVRFLLALGKNGVDIPDNVMAMGMQAIGVIGIQALFKIDPHQVKPLLDEMMSCIEIYPDPTNKAVCRKLVGQDDIEEVTTLVTLRSEVFTLHTGFLVPAIPSTTSSTGTVAGSPNTSTSQAS